MTTPIMNMSGLVSGFDSLSLIDAIIEVARQPIYDMQSKQTDLTDQITAWQTLNTKLLAFKIASDRLKPSSSWDVLSATSSDEDIITATADTDAPTGIYSFTVNQLATNHQISSNGFADIDTTTLGTGTVTLHLGDSLSDQIEIDETNNTLEGLRDAINESSLDISASIINTGDEDAPYQLLISSNDTGADNVLDIDLDLSGGSSLYFTAEGTIGSAGAWGPDPASSTSSVTSGGSYIGSEDKTYTFTVTSGGTVGTDTITLSWDDGTGNNGTISIPSDYDPSNPSEISVGDEGLTVSFGAGDIVSGENFTIDVETGGLNTIQEAQDAEIIFGGSGGGGGNPITVTSSSNTVTDIIDGITLNLHSADSDTTVSLTIERDTDQIENNIESLVSAYNDVISEINAQNTYDSLTETSGVLMGDQTLMTIMTDLKNIIGQKLTGQPDGYQLLSEIGITSNDNGTLTLDSSTLSQALEDDFESVSRMFNESGTSTDNDIRFISGGTDTVESATGYFINITRAATKGTVHGDYFQLDADHSVTINDTNNRFKVKVDGESSGMITLTSGTYTSGDELAAMIEEELSDSSLSDDAVTVEWETDPSDSTRGRIVITSATYGRDSSVEIIDTSSSIYDSIGLESGDTGSGLDVRGTINGETAEGHGQILTGADGNATTAGLSILVDLTTDQLSTQGSFQGRVSFTRGIASDFSTTLDNITNTTDGIITAKTDGLQSQIDLYDDQISDMEDRLAVRRERLIEQYTAMETTISQLQAQGQAMTMQLNQLLGTSTGSSTFGT